MSGDSRRALARALLGSWPQQVSGWGQEGIAAYLSELEARGVEPEAALVAVRRCGGEQRFPPSAPELAALARDDPSRPTFDEAYQQIYGPGGVLGFRREGAVVHPLVSVFVQRYGRGRLKLLEVDDERWGAQRRRELRESWEQFVEATLGREVAEIAAPRHGRLGSFDPGRQIGDGS